LYKLHKHSEYPPFPFLKARGEDVHKNCYRCNFLCTRPYKTKGNRPFFHMLHLATPRLHPTFLCFLYTLRLWMSTTRIQIYLYPRLLFYLLFYPPPLSTYQAGFLTYCLKILGMIEWCICTLRFSFFCTHRILRLLPAPSERPCPRNWAFRRFRRDILENSYFHRYLPRIFRRGNCFFLLIFRRSKNLECHRSFLRFLLCLLLRIGSFHCSACKLHKRKLQMPVYLFLMADRVFLKMVIRNPPPFLLLRCILKLVFYFEVLLTLVHTRFLFLQVVFSLLPQIFF